MEFNDLESEFFSKVLCVEYGVPVWATIGIKNASLEAIVVPEVNETGHFVLRYFNASEYEPEFRRDGTSLMRFTIDEVSGRHPLLESTWRNNDTVQLQLHPSSLLFESKENPNLVARVRYPDQNHRGDLTLNNNQVTVEDVPLVTTKFCVLGFPDFITLKRQAESISNVDLAAFRRLGDSLGPGAKLTIGPASHVVVLDTDDKWRITLQKDENPTRTSGSHSGSIEKTDGGEFTHEELINVLEGLKYFLAFAAGVYRLPTIVIGYAAGDSASWGRIGRFSVDQRNQATWFTSIPLSEGYYLEDLFPKFWSKWTKKKNEVEFIIECYVHSFVMRQAGVPQDAVAKSYAGLETLAGLVSQTTIGGDSDKQIDKELERNKILNRELDENSTPKMTQLGKGLVHETSKNKLGSYLLNSVRNYVTHPLDRKQPSQVKATHAKLLDSNPEQYFLLHDLSQFYLEYLFLSFCGMEAPNGTHRKLLETLN